MRLCKRALSHPCTPLITEWEHLDLALVVSKQAACRPTRLRKPTTPLLPAVYVAHHSESTRTSLLITSDNKVSFVDPAKLIDVIQFIDAADMHGPWSILCGTDLLLFNYKVTFQLYKHMILYYHMSP
jgi:hypothetical protein